MNRLNNFKLSAEALNKFLLLFITVIFSCSKQEKKQINFQISALKFSLYSNQDSLIKNLESSGYFIMGEDSHSLIGRGVALFYYDANYDSLDFFIELYFIKKQLQGIKAKIYSNSLNKDSFLSKVNLIVSDFNANPNLSSLFLDTLRGKSVRPEFTLFVKSKELQEKIE